MSALMTSQCEECGKVVVHEKDEEGTMSVETSPGVYENLCADCAEAHRRSRVDGEDED